MPITDDEKGIGRMEFARTLREAVQRRGLSLHTLRARLRDRGHDVSVATLSMWQSGVRHPGRATSFDVLRELEGLIGLADGDLTATLGPPRRVRAAERRTFAALAHLPRTPFTEEMEPELWERSGSIGAYLAADGRIARTVHRTLWQACRDDARRATVFFGADDRSDPPEVSGILGCSLVDVEFDRELALVRSTLRLDTPLGQGSLALTERQSVRPVGYPQERELVLVAPRRQAELTIYAVFDPALMPTECRVTVDSEKGERSHRLPLNGNCVAHAEFGFGPGVITLDWVF
ncbi:hypothetical protein RAC69_14705 [Microbacterium sp. LS_15]|uniref:hypothetical protein n=1 Tax=Microbacterium sp. LS_15 TaxID=3055790 RepID=UPI0035BFAF6E